MQCNFCTFLPCQTMLNMPFSIPVLVLPYCLIALANIHFSKRKTPETFSQYNQSQCHNEMTKFLFERVSMSGKSSSICVCLSVKILQTQFEKENKNLKKLRSKISSQEDWTDNNQNFKCKTDFVKLCLMSLGFMVSLFVYIFCTKNHLPEKAHELLENLLKNRKMDFCKYGENPCSESRIS